MKVYELMAIVDGSLDEEQYKAALEQIEKTVKSKGGTVTALDEWGKRKLAYSIKKRDFGYYLVWRFTAEQSAVPNELQAALKIQDNVLRSMVTIAQAKRPPVKTETAEKKESVAAE